MMEKIKKILFSPKTTLAVFAVALALLLFSSVGGARAALTYYSENHMTEIETQEIGVSLVENGKLVGAEDPLLTSIPGKDMKLEFGTDYAEELAVQNTGEIDQYVRVTIYKWWEDESGKKMRDVSPGHINLNLTLENGWVEDKSASTDERTVLYYTEPLARGKSVVFADKFSIAEDVMSIVRQDDNGGTVLAYEGLKACLDVDADAVQTHNAADAILSAWGVRVGGSGEDENGALNRLSFSW